MDIEMGKAALPFAITQMWERRPERLSTLYKEVVEAYALGATSEPAMPVGEAKPRASKRFDC